MIDFIVPSFTNYCANNPFLPDEEETLYIKEARVSTINPLDAIFWTHWQTELLE